MIKDLLDPVVILAIFVAGLGLAATLYEKWEKKPLVGTTSAIAILSFLLIVAQLLVGSNLEKKGKEQTDSILESISGTVTHTAGIVDDLSRRLADKPIADLGEQLVVPDASAPEGTRILSKGKASSNNWGAYANWIATNRRPNGPKLCLTFEFNNVERDYKTWLSLAYLFTSSSTEASLRTVIGAGPVASTWSQSYFDRALLDWTGVDVVAFIDRATNQIVAYAPARELASELLLRQRLGDSRVFESILNEPQGVDHAAALARTFHSVRISVLNESSASTIVKTMLERRWPECLAETSSGRFLVSLEKVVRAAA